ncbi:hypothetical protein [Mammaliicoccus sciuri]|uniref:hypothetical protein n=1 Tax=Mammaliicoccus sciuri TaxID=1296 RepID=UPI0018C99375|nr:hypothetical protein [Mammaliicoccus sciuri]MBG9209439.1 hypothetical protein [Mammaliicoccus sciuri]
MNGYIRSRIFIDGMVMKDINQVFDRLDKINLIFGEVLDQDDWEEIFEHTKQASMLIPPMNEQSDTSKDNAVIIGNCIYVCKKSTALEEKDHVYYIYPTHVVSSSEGLPTFKHVTEKGHLLDDKFLEEHFTKLD